MAKIDLTPFGFTPTESLTYSALLRIGPSTGYAVAQATRLARANAYAALEGLVTRGAAVRSAGRPVQYRPADPSGLIAQVAAQQGETLERLSRALERAGESAEPTIHAAEGVRPVTNALQQIVARAERRVVGVVAAELWRPTLPAWRRAAGRAALSVRIAGAAEDPEGLSQGVVSEETPTILLVDEGRLFTAAGTGDGIRALWSTHPLLAQVGRLAVAAWG
jgi:sugar-specific transcriptional regulator TrmB